MSLPLNDREENAVSSIGIETYPENVVVKGSLWTLSLIYSRFLLKDYAGNSFVIDILAKDYALTIALNEDRTINPDKFWLWVIDTSDQLSLYEVEPFVSNPPTISVVRSGIASSVARVSSYIQANDAVRIVTLNTSNELIVLSYPNIKLSAAHVTRELTWEVTRLPNFSNFISGSKNQLDLAYLNVLSPPNIYLESHIIAPPTNLAVNQVGATVEFVVSWDASTDAERYTLERDTDSSFLTPVEVYTGSDTSFTDTLTEVGTYYYRVRALIDSLILQSLWSDFQSIEVILITDFEGAPLIGTPNLSVQFTDLSTPIGAITAWDWDFGDGTPHSTEQNPLHIYESVGVYTVTLTSYVGAFSVSEVKTFYVTVIHTDFEGAPLIGTPNLSVQFTDLSTPIEAITAWDWDFGDGTPHSTEQNPLHVYESVGVYTVTLTSYAGEFSASEVKTFYVTVFSPDFVGEPLTGLQPLSVQFTDLSTPIEAITAWDWDFGDGTPHSTEQNPLHIYYAAGVYTVTLTSYVGLTSASEVKTFYVTVINPGFYPDFIATPLRAYVNEIIQFTDLSIGDPTEWEWNFGDRSVHSTEQNPVHSYASPGFYTVTLRAGSGLTSNSITKVNYIEIVYEESGTGFVRGQGPTLIFD